MQIFFESSEAGQSPNNSPVVAEMLLHPGSPGELGASQKQK